MKMKKALLLLTLAAMMLLMSCSRVAAGINEAVTHENLSVRITDVFGDENNAYILLEAKMADTESVTNGRLNTALVDAKAAGGYSFSLIGRNEEAHTQTYLVTVSGEKRLTDKKIGVSLSDYRSEENPLEHLIEAGTEWMFAFTYKPEAATASKSFDDRAVTEIRLYGNVLVITPKNADPSDSIKASGLTITDASGAALEPVLCSADEARCYLSEIVYVFDPAVAQNIASVTVGETVYSLT